MRLSTKFLAAVAVASVSTAAFSTTCDSALSDYQSNGASSPALQNHPECFGGNSGTSSVSIKQSSSTTNNAVSGALANRFLSDAPIQSGGLGLRGVAAATPGKMWNVWGNLTHNSTDHAYVNTTTGNSIKNGNDGLTAVVGGDYALSPKMVAGVSASFDRTQGVGYNNGTPNSNLTNEGYMFAPYVGYSLSKEMALDASLGFGQGSLSQSGGTSAEADRWYGGVNLNYSTWMGKTQLSGKLGYLHAEERYGKAKLPNGTLVNGTDSTNKIDQLRLGAQAGWWMNGFMPYVGLAYASDIRRASTLPVGKDYIGKDAWVWSVGANFFSLASGIAGGVAYNREASRTNSNNYQFIANISFRF